MAKIKDILEIESQREKWYASLNSYCGVLSHWNNFNLRKRMLNENPEFGRYGMFTMDYKKYHIISHAPFLFS